MIKYAPAPTQRAPSSPATAEDINYKRRMALSMMQDATSAAPVGHWTQALARAAQGAVGGMYASQAATEGKARETYDTQQSAAQRMAANEQEFQEKRRWDEYQRTREPTEAEKLEMDYKRAQAEKLRRDSAMAEQEHARKNALYGMFTGQPGQSQPPPGPDLPDPASVNVGRLSPPALGPQPAPQATTAPQSPQEVFAALPPAKKAAAQIALATGDTATFAKIIGEGPPQLADSLTPGEKRVDQTFAKSYEDFVLSGGAADYDKNLNQLRGVHTEISNPNGANYSGPVLGRMPDAITSYTNPKAVDLRQQVEEIVQRNLRIVLGAQFTQKEGENLIARAYNPALDEATNAKRLERLIGSMEKMKSAKMKAMDYFEKNGTMKGFKGTTQFSVNDIMNDVEIGTTPSGFKYIGTAD